MTPIIKVDRVCSPEEAAELQNLGADIISVSLGEQSEVENNRQVTENMARTIRKSLVNAKFCGEITNQAGLDHTISLIHHCGFDLIQASAINIPELTFRQTASQSGIRFIYSGIEASYDDDPAWILSSFDESEKLEAAYFQVDLLSDVEGSWNFFKNECPKYSEELQIDDINQISAQYPLIISLDFSVENIVEIIEHFENVQGFWFTLGACQKSNDPHLIEYSELVNILKILNKQTSQIKWENALLN